MIWNGICIFLSVMALSAIVRSRTGEINTYNSRNQICCNGTVYDVTDSTYGYSCCGHQAYKYDYYLCCPGNVLAELPEALDGNAYEYSCCVDEVQEIYMAFSDTTHICCQGNLYDKEEVNATGCCGKMYYNHATQLCCKETIYDDPGNQVCCVDEVVYDPSHQICCVKWEETNKYWIPTIALHAKTSYASRCCELQVYNPITDVCCNGVIKQKPTEIDMYHLAVCCNEQIFEPSHQICCKNLLGTRYGIPIHVYKINNKTGIKSQCCQENHFDASSQVCCDNGAILTKPQTSATEQSFMYCCGNQLAKYGDETRRCINDQLYDLSDSSYLDCGTHTYDFTTHNCCHDIVYEVFSNDTVNVGCCHGAKQLFNPKTQICCGEVVITKDSTSADHDSCCLSN